MTVIKRTLKRRRIAKTIKLEAVSSHSDLRNNSVERIHKQLLLTFEYGYRLGFALVLRMSKP